MSAIDNLVHKESNSFPLEVKNISSRFIRTLVNNDSISARTFLDSTDLLSRKSVNVGISNSSTLDNFLYSSTENVISQTTSDTFGEIKDTTPEVISSTTAKNLTGALPEVKLTTLEILEDSGLGTAEHVVIGACVLVVVLACVAIVLRIVMPVIRSKLKQKRDFLDDESSERKSSGSSSGLTNFGTETDSHTSGSSQYWSEVSSDQTRSTDVDEKPVDMADHYGQLRRHLNLAEDFRGSSSSLPTYLPADNEKHSKSSKGSPMAPRRLNDDLVSMISTRSLEPLRLEDNYRNRWDNEWDPYNSLPRGNLSHLSHPSESRMSLSSKSTASSQSNARFPTPSREQVHKTKMDKARRYPTKSSQENIRQDKSTHKPSSR